MRFVDGPDQLLGRNGNLNPCRSHKQGFHLQEPLFLIALHFLQDKLSPFQIGHQGKFLKLRGRFCRLMQFLCINRPGGRRELRLTEKEGDVLPHGLGFIKGPQGKRFLFG